MTEVKFVNTGIVVGAKDRGRTYYTFFLTRDNAMPIQLWGCADMEEAQMKMLRDNFMRAYEVGYRDGYNARAGHQRARNVVEGEIVNE